MALVHFLLIYDHSRQALIAEEAFDDGQEAADAYARLEAEHRNDRNLEIVLVGADSIETIRQTHGHYFEEPAERNGFRYLEGVR